jgi:hypothetical protein
MVTFYIIDLTIKKTNCKCVCVCVCLKWAEGASGEGEKSHRGLKRRG